MALALLFPGQGAQHAAMLPWLDAEPAAAPVLKTLASTLGTDWRLRLAEPGWMHANTVAQPLLTGLGIAAWQTLANLVPAPAVVAGYSVGELAAFAVAGVFEAGTALTLATFRAQAMNACAEGNAGGLLAVQGPQALALAESVPGLHVAIRIGPERLLAGGPSALLDAVAAKGTAAGLRCTRLPITVASHTPLMAKASAAFAKRLAGEPLRPARCPVICNMDAAGSRNPVVLGSALADQIAHTVRWDDCMDAIAERGIRCVLELGPGSTLATMWRERHPEIPVRSADEFRGPEGMQEWIAHQLA